MRAGPRDSVDPAASALLRREKLSIRRGTVAPRGDAAIGYGNMYPESRLANVLMVGESVTELVVTALPTGLVFARFSQTRARLMFSSRAAVGPHDGVPSLLIRVGN